MRAKQKTSTLNPKLLPAAIWERERESFKVDKHNIKIQTKYLLASLMSMNI
jgi:hypothetical protein